ncbi:MAG: radical SAM protein [Pseudomonadota bacterium]
MSVRLVTGGKRLRAVLSLAWRLARAGLARWGFFGLGREFWRYLRDHRNLFDGAGSHLVALEDRGEIYAASALPPITSGRFVDYVLEEVETFNRRQPAPLVFALLSVSSRCPFRCRHCYAAAELQAQGEALSLDDLERAIRDLDGWKVPSIFLTGGEPLMRREELPALLERVAGLGLAFWLVTTGWGADAGLLRRLAVLGLRGIIVSLDSADMQAAARSKGHPEALPTAVAAIRAAQEAGLIVSVDCMVPAGSPLLEPGGYHAFLDFLTRLGVHFVNFFPPHPSGGAEAHHLPALAAADVHRLEALMNASNARPGEHPLAYAAVVWELHRGCVGGQQFIYVDPQGGVRACPFLRGTSGNIKEERLAAILRRLRAEGEQPGCFAAFSGLVGRRRTDRGG